MICPLISEPRCREIVPVEWFAITLSLSISRYSISALSPQCIVQHITPYYTYIHPKHNLFQYLPIYLYTPAMCCPVFYCATGNLWKNITFTFLQPKRQTPQGNNTFGKCFAIQVKRLRSDGSYLKKCLHPALNSPDVCWSHHDIDHKLAVLWRRWITWRLAPVSHDQWGPPGPHRPHRHTRKTQKPPPGPPLPTKVKTK